MKVDWRLPNASGQQRPSIRDKTTVVEIEAALKELTGGRGADLGVEVSGATIGIPNLIAWLAIGGRCPDTRLRLSKLQYFCRRPPARYKMCDTERHS